MDKVTGKLFVQFILLDYLAAKFHKRFFNLSKILNNLLIKIYTLKRKKFYPYLRSITSLTKFCQAILINLTFLLRFY
jgi:hypothetical protein